MYFYRCIYQLEEGASVGFDSVAAQAPNKDGKRCVDKVREAAKKVFFSEARPLKEGGGGVGTKKKTFFEALKKFQKIP